MERKITKVLVDGLNVIKLTWSKDMLKSDLKFSFDFLPCRVFQSQLPENGAPLLPPRALTSQSLPELFHDHVIEQVSNSWMSSTLTPK